MVHNPKSKVRNPKVQFCNITTLMESGTCFLRSHFIHRMMKLQEYLDPVFWAPIYPRLQLNQLLMKHTVDRGQSQFNCVVTRSVGREVDQPHATAVTDRMRI